MYWRCPSPNICYRFVSFGYSHKPTAHCSLHISLLIDSFLNLLSFTHRLRLYRERYTQFSLMLNNNTTLYIHGCDRTCRIHRIKVLGLSKSSFMISGGISKTNSAFLAFQSRLFNRSERITPLIGYVFGSCTQKDNL
jgi:hypothetical protein